MEHPEQGEQAASAEPGGMPAAGLAPGDRLTVAVDDIAFGGEGVARHGSFVVFVPFTAPGCRGGGSHRGEEAFRARQAPAGGEPVAGAGGAALPLLWGLRRLPVSAPCLQRAAPAQAEADCRAVSADRPF
ncbi:MAG: TRAM domain-containing protein [Verrucomicrobiota bacterium]